MTARSNRLAKGVCVLYIEELLCVFINNIIAYTSASLFGNRV